MCDYRFALNVGCLVTCLGLLTAAGWAQQEQYGEREVLDPETDEWVAQAAPPEETPSGTLEQAYSLLARGEEKKARNLLEDWVEENPNHEHYLDAMFHYGEACFQCGDYWAAYEAYELVVEESAGDLFYKTLRREVDVARAFLSGEKRIVWKILRVPAYDDGIEILDRVWERVPGTPLGELALKEKADYYFRTGEMGFAQDEYVELVREYPSGRYVQSAMMRAAEAAEAAFPGIRFDDRSLLEADERYRQVQGAFPAYAEQQHVDERLEGIRRQRAEKDLDIAKWYERTKQPGSAEFYYRTILKEWPDTLAASEARNRLRAMGADMPEQEESSP